MQIGIVRSSTLSKLAFNMVLLNKYPLYSQSFFYSEQHNHKLQARIFEQKLQ